MINKEIIIEKEMKKVINEKIVCENIAKVVRVGKNSKRNSRWKK